VCDNNTIVGGCCRQDGARLGGQKRAELVGLLWLWFVRVEPWLQARRVRRRAARMR
jgi:hypothetical protein